MGFNSGFKGLTHFISGNESS